LNQGVEAIFGSEILFPEVSLGCNLATRKWVKAHGNAGVGTDACSSNDHDLPRLQKRVGDLLEELLRVRQNFDGGHGVAFSDALPSVFRVFFWRVSNLERLSDSKSQSYCASPAAAWVVVGSLGSRLPSSVTQKTAKNLARRGRSSEVLVHNCAFEDTAGSSREVDV
jgi:hypothetical protein